MTSSHCAIIRFSFIVCALGFAWISKADSRPGLLDSSVRYGRLDNGLTYYIARNEAPSGQAEFYIAQKVGSILEEENQRGLAHFLEHMAFNGTRHFPGKSMIDWLEHSGVRFGTDLNAYTSIDRTVYSISNVPSRQSVVDSCLLILHDWSGFIALEEEEIDAERAVIHEEWRSKNSASSRMTEALLPQLFPDSNRYASRLPIGLMEVVDNFPHQALRDYYHKWYRPDLQGVVVVGDIDVDRVEARIRELWQDIPAQPDAAVRYRVEVPDNREPIVAIATDAEARSGSLKLSYKHDYPTDSLRLTPAGVADDYLTAIAVALLDARLKERVAQPGSKLVAPRATYGDYSISSTKGAVSLLSQVRGGDWEPAMKALVAEMKGAMLDGFDAAEYEATRDELRRSIRASQAGRIVLTNNQLTKRLVDHFLLSRPAPSMAEEAARYDSLLLAFTPEQLTARLRLLLGSGNLVITYQGEAGTAPSREALLDLYNKAWQADAAPRIVRAKVSGELMPTLPAPGHIVSSTVDEQHGLTELRLSNGARVLLVPSRLKPGEIQFKAFSEGGTSVLPDSLAPTFGVINSLIPLGGLGQWSNAELGQIIEGRSVNYSVSVNTGYEQVSGSCAAADLETLLQLVYLRMTTARQDSAQFAAWQSRSIASLAGRGRSAMTLFSDSLSRILYGNHPRLTPPSRTIYEGADYDAVCRLFLDRFANAADFTFILLGDFSEPTVRPLIEQYIASLPSTMSVGSGKASAARKRGKSVSQREKVNENAIPAPRPGRHACRIEVPMKTPKTTVIYQVQVGKPYSFRSMLAADILRQVVEMVCTERLREQLGGTYGVRVSLGHARTRGGSLSLNLSFDTNEAQADTLLLMAVEALRELAREGADEAMIRKAKEFMLKQYPTYSQTNGYRMSMLTEWVQYGEEPERDFEATLAAITAEEITDIARLLTESENVVEGRIVGKPTTTK